jgi:epoxyqueuosine reductase
LGRGRDRDQLSRSTHRILQPLKKPLSLTPSLLAELKTISDELGFDLLGAAAALIPQRHQDAYLNWISQGHGADMAYMTGDPAKRVAPQQTFPGAQTVLSLGVSYFQGDVPPKPGPAHGRVARYAWGADYHDVIGERLRLFIERIKNILGDVNCTLATDTKPVLERALAESAGMGFVGKNTVFIIPQGPARKSAGGRDDGGPRFHVGSWLFLAEIFIDVPLAAEAAPARVENGCGGCTNCLTACPTDAFEGPYKLNAGKCIAYHTQVLKSKVYKVYKVETEFYFTDFSLYGLFQTHVFR